jgi:hypothetical protein
MRVCVNVNGDADPTARGLIAHSGSIETARGLERAAPFDDHKAAFLRHLASTIVPEDRIIRSAPSAASATTLRLGRPVTSATTARKAGRHIRSGLLGQSALAGDVYDHSRPIGRSVTADDDADANVALRGGTAVDCAWDLCESPSEALAGSSGWSCTTACLRIGYM